MDTACESLVATFYLIIWTLGFSGEGIIVLVLRDLRYTTKILKGTGFNICGRVEEKIHVSDLREMSWMNLLRDILERCASSKSL